MVATSVASSSSLRCLVTAWRVMSRCMQSSESVCPLLARSRSSSKRRSGAASALKTLSTSAPIGENNRQLFGCMSSVGENYRFVYRFLGETPAAIRHALNFRLSGSEGAVTILNHFHAFFPEEANLIFPGERLYWVFTGSGFNLKSLRKL